MTTAAVALDVGLQAPLSAEDSERADWYALIATLFHEPPSDLLLARLGQAAAYSSDSDLGRALAGLGQAATIADRLAVRAEFEATFIGIGKAEVLPYASYYLSGFLNERPLVELRSLLAGLGIGKRADSGLTEDHLSALCEMMRYLIMSDDPALARIETQRAVFGRFISPWFESFCDALETSNTTDFYKHVGRMARVFFAIDRQAFDFDE